MPAVAAEPHTTAVAEALAAAGLLVGRGAPPSGGGWQGEPIKGDHKPYVVLYPSTGTTDGVLGDPHEDLDYTVQITCVAAKQDLAERVADRVKAALVGVRLTVPGRGMYPFQLLVDRPVTRDDQVSPPVHYAVVQVSARSGPA